MKSRRRSFWWNSQHSTIMSDFKRTCRTTIKYEVRIWNFSIKLPCQSNTNSMDCFTSHLPNPPTLRCCWLKVLEILIRFLVPLISQRSIHLPPTMKDDVAPRRESPPNHTKLLLLRPRRTIEVVLYYAYRIPIKSLISPVSSFGFAWANCTTRLIYRTDPLNRVCGSLYVPCHSLPCHAGTTRSSSRSSSVRQWERNNNDS